MATFAQVLAQKKRRAPAAGSAAWWRDVGRSALQGVQEIPGTILGLPGDLGRLHNSLQQNAAENGAHLSAYFRRLNRAQTRLAVARARQSAQTAARFNAYSRAPSSADVTHAVEGVTHYHHDAETRTGQAAQFLATMLPAVVDLPAAGASVVRGLGARAAERAVARVAAREAASAANATRSAALEAHVRTVARTAANAAAGLDASGRPIRAMTEVEHLAAQRLAAAHLAEHGAEDMAGARQIAARARQAAPRGPASAPQAVTTFKPDAAGHGYDMGQFLPHGERPNMGGIRTTAPVTQQVPVSSLSASQSYVHTDFMTTQAGRAGKPIEVFQDHNGVNHVLDGNHRAAAAAARGDTHINAVVHHAHPDAINAARAAEADHNAAIAAEAGHHEAAIAMSQRAATLRNTAAAASTAGVAAQVSNQAAAPTAPQADRTWVARHRVLRNGREVWVRGFWRANADTRAAA